MTDIKVKLFQSSPLVAGGRVDGHRRHPASTNRFNPRPSLPGGASSRSATDGLSGSRFNPRPSLPGGASRRRRQSWGRRCRFNPRPSLPGGASITAEFCGPSSGVSILAPRCRGARLYHRGIVTPLVQFQSSPLVAGGRVGSRATGGNRWLFGLHCADRRLNLRLRFHQYSDRLTAACKFNILAPARTLPGFNLHLRSAHRIYTTSGPSKSVARKLPCSRTSQPRTSGSR